MKTFEWKEPKPTHPVRVPTDEEARPLLKELGLVIQNQLLNSKKRPVKR